MNKTVSRLHQSAVKSMSGFEDAYAAHIGSFSPESRVLIEMLYSSQLHLLYCVEVLSRRGVTDDVPNGQTSRSQKYSTLEVHAKNHQ